MRSPAAAKRIVLATMLGWVVSAQAQVTVVTLGEVSAGPNTEVMVPVLLNPASSETRVGKITAVIPFNAAAVTFLRAEKGFLLDGVGATLQAELQPDGEGAAGSSIRFAVATQGQPRRALREGILFSLIFRIHPEAPAKTEVPLRLESLAAESIADPPESVAPLTGVAGSIEVLSPDAVPYVGCFFFTH